MPIELASRRVKPDNLRRRFGNDAEILDVTSRGPEPWVRFSPFFPHGGIPVPLTPGEMAASVEGIWQALKVFESADVDPSKLSLTRMRGIKRSARKHGRVLGHRAGLRGATLLPYIEARRAIYLPAYRWVLEHRLGDEVARLRELSARATVVLLDYEKNADVNDPSRPLSHAALARLHAEGRWSELEPTAPAIRYLTGDATRPAGEGPRIIAHVCNDVGSWGAGFVLALSARWPEPEARFRAWHATCEEDGRPFELGQTQLVEVAPELWVANLIGQHGLRRRGGQPPVRYDAIREGLTRLGALAAERDASVHMPRIACGFAGGEWSLLQPMIAETLLHREIPVTVYDLP